MNHCNIKFSKYMAYSLNPNLPRVRAEACKMVLSGKSVTDTARYYGFSKGCISKWLKKYPACGLREIVTKSSRPKTHPKKLSSEIVRKILDQRIKTKRCSEVVQKQLEKEGIKVSLSSIKRTLKRNYLIKEKSPWKKLHKYTPSIKARKQGELVQIDTIHIMNNKGSRTYIYTALDVFSRYAFAKAYDRICVKNSLNFLKQLNSSIPFKINHLQTDHGPEFTQGFTRRTNIPHRHSRVRRPNDNAHLERFNRTIQEELINKLTPDANVINKHIPSYLKYYNTERLHMGLNFKTPSEIIK